MYAVKIRSFRNHFQGDKAFTDEIIHVDDAYIDRWNNLDDKHCKTIDWWKVR